MRKQVAQAVLKLIRDGCIDFNYQDVANESRASKATLYRRWPQRADLLREALTEHNSRLKVPTSADWPDSAEVLLRRFATFVADPVELSMNVALIADPSTETSAMVVAQWAPIEEQIARVVVSAQQQGHLPPDIDARALMNLLLAPILVSTLLQRQRIDRKFLGELIRMVRRMRFSAA